MSQPSDAKLWAVVEGLLWGYARYFHLPLKKTKLLSPDKDFYGDCSNDGRIRIQLRRGSRRLFAYQIIDTMAHELAHLEHNNHKAPWFALHVHILAQMGHDGVYRQLKRLCKKTH